MGERRPNMGVVERLPFDALCRVILQLELPERVCVARTHSSLARAAKDTEAWNSIHLGLLSYSCSDLTVEQALTQASACGAQPEAIDLTGCIHLTDASLEAVARCPSLRKLRIDGTVGFRMGSITDAGLDALIGGCARLQELSLRRLSRVTSSGFENIARGACASTLTSLDLMGCTGMRDGAVAALGRCSSLRSLSLKGCRGISSIGLTQMLTEAPVTAPPLTELNLDGCLHVGDRALHAIAAGLSDTLERLSLAGCASHSSGTDAVTDEGIEVLARSLTVIRELSLTGCKQLTGQGIVAMSQALSSDLEVLNIQHLPKVKASHVVKVAEALPSLLTLRKGFLNDQALIHVCASLPGLQCLSIGAPKVNRTISDQGLAAVGSLGGLRSLSIAGLVQCGNVCEIVSELEQLRELDLRGCSEHAIVGLLKRLQYIYNI